jgi:orotate phosphoribosyltransferase
MSTASEFIQFLVDSGALRFGDFTTKSGRKSPYFINTGEFRTGASLGRLAGYYAKAFKERFGGKADNLFGPAYKGIPLAATTATALEALFGMDLSFSYNRKEAKDHGEGGLLVGDAYKEARRVVIIEDVVTAGTSVRETFELFKGYPNAKPVGLLVSVDRKEKLDSGRSAMEEIRREFGIETAAIADIDDIIAYIGNGDNRSRLGLDDSLLERIRAYRAQYGA